MEDEGPAAAAEGAFQAGVGEALGRTGLAAAPEALAVEETSKLPQSCEAMSPETSNHAVAIEETSKLPQSCEAMSSGISNNAVAIEETCKLPQSCEAMSPGTPKHAVAIQETSKLPQSCEAMSPGTPTLLEAKTAPNRETTTLHAHKHPELKDSSDLPSIRTHPAPAKDAEVDLSEAHREGPMFKKLRVMSSALSIGTEAENACDKLAEPCMAETTTAEAKPNEEAPLKQTWPDHEDKKQAHLEVLPGASKQEHEKAEPGNQKSGHEEEDGEEEEEDAEEETAVAESEEEDDGFDSARTLHYDPKQDRSREGITCFVQLCIVLLCSSVLHVICGRTKRCRLAQCHHPLLRPSPLPSKP